MQHPIMFWSVYALICLYALHKFLTRKDVPLDKYEYLEVLSVTEWKTADEITTELEKIHKGVTLGFFEVRTNLRILIDEDLVYYCEPQNDYIKFRKKPGDYRRA